MVLTTLITPEASSALLGAGITVQPVGPVRISLSIPDDASPVVVGVRRRRSPLSPSHVHRLVQEEPGRGAMLVVVPAASDAALAAARDVGLSVLVVGDGTSADVRGHVVLGAATVPVGDQEAMTASVPPPRPGPTAWGALTVVRHLLTGAVAGQQEFAARADVSQGRVSQVLSPLVGEGLVRRTTVGGRARWAAEDWDVLADRWLASYPGPGGITTYWYGLSPVREQAEAVGGGLAGAGLVVAVSGDVAADVLAPWRRPARAVLYADVREHPGATDLTGSGLVPSGAEEATLELVLPVDPGLWPWLPREAVEHLPVADGMQVLWDVRRAPGSDVDQTVAVLRRALRERAAARAEER